MFAKTSVFVLNSELFHHT